MTNKPSQCFIVGGGSSLSTELASLQPLFKNKFTIGINFSYKFIDTTCLVCVDTIKKEFNCNKPFYDVNRNDLKNLPLIIGAQLKPHQTAIPWDNTIFLKPSKRFDRTLKTGIFNINLSGCFALTLAIHMLDIGEVFLLGYDGDSNKNKDEKKRWITHFYQGKVEHSGIGNINCYSNNKFTKATYEPYLKETQVKIWNVGLNSYIPYFEKIDYKTLYEKIDKNEYNQDELRAWIRDDLAHLV